MNGGFKLVQHTHTAFGRNKNQHLNAWLSNDEEHTKLRPQTPLCVWKANYTAATIIHWYIVYGWHTYDVPNMHLYFIVYRQMHYGYRAQFEYIVYTYISFSGNTGWLSKNWHASVRADA